MRPILYLLLGAMWPTLYLLRSSPSLTAYPDRGFPLRLA